MEASRGTDDSQFNAAAGREVAELAVAPHLPLFGQVLTEAWNGFATARQLAPKQMAYAGSSARGMLVSEFTREPAHRIFNMVPEAALEDDQFRRPWVRLDGGGIRVRFRKLTPDLGLCRSDSDRALSLAHHLGDPCLPGMENFTVLTAGYVLDRAEENIERLELVCHLGFTDVFYSLPIPMHATAGATDVTAPAQLPLAPISAPIIRSAQKAAAKRLAAGGNTAARSSSGDDDV